jgi:hypothetical protein
MIHILNPIEISPSTLLGLLCASGANRLPARSWPVEAALHHVRATAPRDGSVGRALTRWPLERSTEGPRLAGLASVIRELAATGALVPSGSGWEAGYLVSEEWRDSHSPLLASLPSADRRALAQAAHRLTARVRTFSNKAAVAGS